MLGRGGEVGAAPEELGGALLYSSLISHTSQASPSSASCITGPRSALSHFRLSGFLVKSSCDYREAEKSF